MRSRWDFVLDLKPISLVDHLLEEVAKIVAKDLARWPLPVQQLDAETGRSFAALLLPDARRPADVVFHEAFRLARWELERDFDGSAEYMRNRRYLEHGIAESDRQALLLVSRWLVEQLLSLKEATEGRIKRPQLVDCLDRIRRRFSRVTA